LYMWLYGPQGRSGRVRKIPPGFDPRTVHPVASRYSDWAIAAPVGMGSEFKANRRPIYVVFPRLSRSLTAVPSIILRDFSWFTPVTCEIFYAAMKYATTTFSNRREFSSFLSHPSSNNPCSC
jgi:hypothetical protein